MLTQTNAILPHKLVMLKLIRNIHFEKLHVDASVSHPTQVFPKSILCIHKLQPLTLRVGIKNYVEAYSSSNAGARDPEEKGQNK